MSREPVLKHFVWEAVPGAGSADDAVMILQKVQDLKEATGQEDLKKAWEQAFAGVDQIVDTIAFVFRNIAETIATAVNILACAGFEEPAQEDFELTR